MGLRDDLAAAAAARPERAPDNPGAPFALAIRTFRLACGFSQADLANVLGITSNTVSSWEHGRSIPSRMAVKLLRREAEDRGVPLFIPPNIV